MKIEDIDFVYKKIPLERSFSTSTGGVSNSSSLFVRVVTSEGIVGYGSGYPTSMTDEDVKSALYFSDMFKKNMIGKDPLRIEDLEKTMNGITYGNPSVKFAFNTAFWDIFGKYHKAPIFELMGYEKRSMPTSITIGINDQEAMIKDAIYWMGKGFRFFKVKLGDDVDFNIGALGSIREQLGPEVSIRCDANGAMSLNDARRFIKLARGLDLEFLEQPVKAEEDMAVLSVNSNIRIAGDESIPDKHYFPALLGKECFHIANIKLNRFGGITSGMKMVHAAELYEVPCMIGCMSENAISIAASLHLALAMGNVRFADLDTFLFLKYHPAKGIKVKRGVLSPSKAPGLGVEVDKKIFKRGSKPSLSRS